MLLDQRVVCGIGNVYKSEALWALRVDPFAPVGALDDDLLGAIYAEARRQMLAAVAGGREGPHRIYRQPACPRCGGPGQRPRPGRRRAHDVLVRILSCFSGRPATLNVRRGTGAPARPHGGTCSGGRRERAQPRRDRRP